MKFETLAIDGMFLLKPEVFQDERGFFRRNFCQAELKNLGVDFHVFQGNISENLIKHTLRGFHFQKRPGTENKILTPVSGSIFNVVIDLRPESGTFLKKQILILDSAKRESLLVPAGCANCFLTMEEKTVIQYYMGDQFKPDTYSGFRYDDPFFNIEWPCKPKLVSSRDNSFPNFDLGIL